MRQRTIRRLGLIAVNAVMLGALGAVTFAPTADAQQQRVRGDYIMVAGGANGSLSSLVYIVDTSNNELIALSYEPNSKQMQGVGFRDMTSDAIALGAQGR